jgi:hypothetical protein
LKVPFKDKIEDPPRVHSWYSTKEREWAITYLDIELLGSSGDNFWTKVIGSGISPSAATPNRIWPNNQQSRWGKMPQSTSPAQLNWSIPSWAELEQNGTVHILSTAQFLRAAAYLRSFRRTSFLNT